MDSVTIQLLNQLNHQFYQKVANHFDETRSRPWSGWTHLLAYLRDSKTPLKVLDVGCGNGRFGVFLHTHFPLFYTGIDSNSFLLERAQETLSQQGIKYHLQQADMLSDFSPDNPPYDLITVFGVMHHIPGFEQRRDFLQKMSTWLSENGILAVTFWAFYEQERLKEHIVAWDNPRVPEPYRNLPVEKHDYLLDWRRGTSALRYCHYVDAEEQQKLIEGFKVAATYDADGSNRYVILKRP